MLAFVFLMLDIGWDGLSLFFREAVWLLIPYVPLPLCRHDVVGVLGGRKPPRNQFKNSASPRGIKRLFGRKDSSCQRGALRFAKRCRVQLTGAACSSAGVRMQASSYFSSNINRLLHARPSSGNRHLSAQHTRGAANSTVSEAAATGAPTASVDGRLEDL